MLSLSRSGLRGLQILSLSECRNISDGGLSKITELKYLRRLNLLGCIKLEDEGLRCIAHQFPFLQELDLGSTNVTAPGLQDLVANSNSLRIVSVKGCKKLNNSDDQILRRSGIVCSPVEDTFRFHLLPQLGTSDLPQITRSVLKTRSTLGLNKVYKYLFKRLVNMNVEDLQRSNGGQPNNGNQSDDANDSFQQDDSGATVPESEERIEILCNG